MIFLGFYEENRTSLDFLGAPRTSQDLLGPPGTSAFIACFLSNSPDAPTEGSCQLVSPTDAENGVARTVSGSQSQPTTMSNVRWGTCVHLIQSTFLKPIPASARRQQRSQFQAPRSATPLKKLLENQSTTTRVLGDSETASGQSLAASCLGRQKHL